MTNNLKLLLKYIWSTKEVWWFTSTSKTKAIFAKTAIGGFWLGLSNILSISLLASIYGLVFKVSSFKLFIVYLGLGLVVWDTISSCISTSPKIFETNKTQILNTNTNPIFFTFQEWSFHIQNLGQSLILVLFSLSFFKYELIFNFLKVGLLPFINILIFIYWFPLLISLLGMKYKDLYQLIPIVLRLIFLTSPLLFERERLGDLKWVSNFSLPYLYISDFRDSLISGQIFWLHTLFLFVLNLMGFLFSIVIFNKFKKLIPFYI